MSPLVEAERAASRTHDDVTRLEGNIEAVSSLNRCCNSIREKKNCSSISQVQSSANAAQANLKRSEYVDIDKRFGEMRVRAKSRDDDDCFTDLRRRLGRADVCVCVCVCVCCVDQSHSQRTRNRRS